MTVDDSNVQEFAKDHLHDLRKEIDAIIQRIELIRFSGDTGTVTKTLNELAGREISVCHTKLQEAKMWLGQALGRLGSELPEEFRDKA